MALYDPVALTPAEQLLATLETPAGVDWVVTRAAAAGVPGLTAQHVRNMVRLARYLRTLPADYAQFEMGHYYAERHHSGAHAVEVATGGPDYAHQKLVVSSPIGCGTTACAVGHGPAAGIEYEAGVSWGTYAYDNFGGMTGSPAFSGIWSSYDNTVRGAAARICYVLADPINSARLNPVYCGHVEMPKRVALYAEYVA